MNNNKNGEKPSLYRDSIRPIVVLLIICLIVAAALAGINSMTEPIIAANEEEMANATYFALLPDADQFKSLPCDIEGVTAVLKAENGAGYVITAQDRGYGGPVPAAVAFSADGTILKVIMMENGETPGMGQKVRNEEFTDQFTGMEAKPLTVDDIDAITGATISSRAAASAISLAVEAFNTVVKGGAA